jgi:ABC-type dipeptide/oligopeptide/nickel transport system permease subunit
MHRTIAFARQHPHFTVYAALALTIVALSALAGVIAPYDPTAAELTNALAAPSPGHPCGTDALGRDVLSRVIWGGRASIAGAVILVAVVFVVGTALGMIGGFFGGAVDAVIMRVADAMIAFPDLILAIAVAGILGPNLTNSIIAIALVSWPRYARIARSLAIKIKNREYVVASRVSGSKTGHIFHKYLFPNALPTMLVTAGNDIGAMMLAMASLSFLGFGAQPPTPEWGYMLSEGRNYLTSAPWLLMFPGLAIGIVVACFNLLGDSLRDVIDPKSRE